ncbi:MAG: hypothetical protein V1722_04045 [Candidatus Micrarchaeota archaeon]
MVTEREAFLKKAKAGVKKAFSRRDLLVMQAVRSIDDTDKAKNVLFTRVVEWFKLNFPEADVQNEEVLCKVVAIFGKKENFEYNTLAEITGEVKAAEIIEITANSFGAEISDADANALKEISASTLNLFESRKKIEKYVGKAAVEAFPNLCAFLDPLLAARLVTIAGGLERLAKMPGSTIQVLGAEKALFKHLRKGTNPPKHGILFQSPLVRNAKEGNRGKIARSLAAKLALAARADFYTGHFIADKLKANLEKRIGELK